MFTRCRGAFHKICNRHWSRRLIRNHPALTLNILNSPHALKFSAVSLATAALVSQKPLTEIGLNDVEENLLHLMTLARIALERGDADRAEAIIQMGLKICEDRKMYYALPHLYEILISISFAEADFDKAENLLVEVIEKLAQVGTPENDHYIVDFKLRLARIYSGNNKSALAEIGFKTCLEDQRAKLFSGDYSMRTGLLYVNVLFWYGVHKIRNGCYTEAQHMLDDAYEYSNKIKGLSPYQEMVILYTLSDINVELGKYEVALENMLNAILLGKGISSVDLPRCYVKLARIYLELNSKENAKASALEGAKLAKLFNNNELAEEAEAILKKIK